MEFNIMMVVCEDDKQLKSTFFLDIGHLLKKYNSIPIHILYHSENFYNSLSIEINKDTYISKKIKTNNINYKEIKNSIKTIYKKYYNPNKKNILYYGGHSNWLFKDFKTCLESDIFDYIEDIELLILDSCYTSYTNLLFLLIGKVKYVMACSTASPNLGFLDNTFIDILNTKSMKDIDKYKSIIDLFLLRNSNDNIIYKKFNYRTDASLIDMKLYIEVDDYIKKNDIKKKKACKIENLSYYYFYDLICLIDDKEIINKIKRCILYSRVNDLGLKHFKKRNLELGGIIIGIK